MRGTRHGTVSNLHAQSWSTKALYIFSSSGSLASTATSLQCTLFSSLLVALTSLIPKHLKIARSTQEDHHHNQPLNLKTKLKIWKCPISFWSKTRELSKPIWMQRLVAKGATSREPELKQISICSLTILSKEQLMFSEVTDSKRRCLCHSLILTRQEPCSPDLTRSKKMICSLSLKIRLHRSKRTL